jgi:uncharacterized membrane protein
MKKLDFNQKIGLGLILISLSLVIKRILPDHSTFAMEFFQGLCTGAGITLILVGSIQKRKSLE